MNLYKKIVFFILIFAAFQGYAQNTLDVLGLDNTTPAAVAYSLRKVSTSYVGNAIQVRRSSDNATQDIGFDNNGDLDTSALLAFVSSDNGYVSIWYDQSGNGRDLIKTDYDFQPQIVFAGAFKYIGTRVAIDFLGNKGLVYSGSLSLASITSVIRSESAIWPGHHCILEGSPRIGGILENGGTTFHFNVYPLEIWKDGISKTTSESLAPVDEAMVLSISPQTDNLYQIFIGNYDGGNDGGSILESEAIAFSSLNPSNIRLSIECNQGSYYRIAMNSCPTAIWTNPSSSDHFECLGTTATSLTVQASGTNLLYQWYSNSSSSTSGGTLISDANSNIFIPPTSVAGTTYYYVVVSGSDGPEVTSSISGAITVDALPTVSISPTSAIINSGESVTLTASGANSYFWGFINAVPLDHVPNSKLAVGLRRLSSSYTGSAIRLRRDSDDTEADFGFINNELDIAAIAIWLGSANGYCVILYDQSGNGNNMTPSDSSTQPLFVPNGLNDKPILRFNTNQNLGNSVDFPPPFTVIYGAKQTGPSRNRVMTSMYNNWLLGWWGGFKSKAHYDSWITNDFDEVADSNAYVYSGTGDGINSEIYENGVSKTIFPSGGVSGPNGITINYNESSESDVTEIYAFNTVLSSTDREAIEHSTASYYGIYGDAPLGNTASIIVSPTETTSYSLTGYSANGSCSATSNVTITVFQNPNLINFGDIIRTYFDGNFIITPPSTLSSGTLTYTSSNNDVATINGTLVTIVGPGITTITVSQETDGVYFGSVFTATLTINDVTVLTKNGKVSTRDFNYVNRNGAIASSTALTTYGESISAKSNNGLSAASSGISAVQIKADFPNSVDGVYWINLPNVGPTQIYCIMDSAYNGGGWMLAMKATNGITFNYDATYWTAANTLNSTDNSRNDGDAKYETMNNYEAKDLMAIWPDISNNNTESGSIDGLSNWTWLQNDFHDQGLKTTLISKFSGSQTEYYSATDGSMTFSGYGESVFSNQEGYTFYGINYMFNSGSRVRWGFAWNNETDQGSNDISGGIGMDSSYGGYSAGDKINCCQINTGVDRAARVEVYIR
ncbi:arabinofuranosidase catalytic domain-containing protein [Flavobacterium sp. AED]|uniref:fibrinogen-like YCDxxxxGGGW domain-containing protein n=1 Tax=Flavobacterium sp. AED TaxID=1423323 RepID=UPI000689A44B|nr:arabinofuranosidase catalytic domain-containing protein [Flavobacterium sp. AED]